MFPFYTPFSPIYIQSLVTHLDGIECTDRRPMCQEFDIKEVNELAVIYITDPEEIKTFADPDYCFSPAFSGENNYVFIRSK